MVWMTPDTRVSAWSREVKRRRLAMSMARHAAYSHAGPGSAPAQHSSTPESPTATKPVPTLRMARMTPITCKQQSCVVSRPLTQTHNGLVMQTFMWTAAQRRYPPPHLTNLRLIVQVIQNMLCREGGVTGLRVHNAEAGPAGRIPAP